MQTMPGPSSSPLFSGLFAPLHVHGPGFARASIVFLMEIRANSKRVPSARRASLNACRSSTFLSFQPANPIAHQRQLHPRKSDRQFVSRSQSVLLNFIVPYRVALTCSLLNPAPNFDTGRNGFWPYG